MAYGRSNKYMDAAAEIRGNPVSTHQIQHEHGDGQADAGRDCRTHFARPNSHGERGQGKTNFPCSLTTIRIGNFTRLILPLLYVMTIHIY